MAKKKDTQLQQVSQVAVQQVRLDFSPETVDLIKRTVAEGATDDELKLFLYQAKRTGLDPLARQIYFVKRGGRVVIQTSIDGFRVVAERHGDYAGQDEPEFIEKGDLTHPIIAKVRVYKFRGVVRYLAATGVAYWDEYVPSAGQDFMWKKMPHTMLAKVAEALALRKAFPQDLSGLYTDEEMAQADKSEKIAEKKAEVKKATDVQIAQIRSLALALGQPVDDVEEKLKDYFKVKEIAKLTSLQADGAITKLKRMVSDQNIETVAAEEVVNDSQGEQIANDAVQAGL